jgi:hypothetical protein
MSRILEVGLVLTCSAFAIEGVYVEKAIHQQTTALQAIAASVGKPVSVSLVQPLKITLTDAAGIDCQALNTCHTDALNQKPEKRGRK